MKPHDRQLTRLFLVVLTVLVAALSGTSHAARPAGYSTATCDGGDTYPICTMFSSTPWRCDLRRNGDNQAAVAYAIYTGASNMCDGEDYCAFGTDGNGNTFYGGGGADSIFGQADDDILFGGDDSDEISGGLGNDTIRGDAHDDYLAGYDGDDDIDGGPGNDQVCGDPGTDTLKGGIGDDQLWAGSSPTSSSETNDGGTDPGGGDYDECDDHGTTNSNSETETSPMSRPACP